MIRRYYYWDDGRIRDEYLVLLGLSIRDGWFPLALIVGALAAPFLKG